MSDNSIDETALLQLAQTSGLVLAPEHRPGVLLYYRMLADFAATVAAFPLDEHSEPAGIFTPCTKPTPD